MTHRAAHSSDHAPIERIVGTIRFGSLTRRREAVIGFKELRADALQAVLDLSR